MSKIRIALVSVLAAATVVAGAGAQLHHVAPARVHLTSSAKKDGPVTCCEDE